MREINVTADHLAAMLLGWSNLCGTKMTRPHSEQAKANMWTAITRVVAAGIILGYCAHTLAGRGYCPPPETFWQRNVTIEQVIEWTLVMPSIMTNADALWLVSNLTNVSDRRFSFAGDSQVAQPQLVLTPKGKEPIVRDLSWDTGVETLFLSRRPPAGSDFCVFRVDLREYFGKLAPGAYSVQIKWSTRGFRTDAFAEGKPVDLESPEMKFQIVDVNLREATRQFVKWVKSWEADKARQNIEFSHELTTVNPAQAGLLVGKLTNTGREAVYFPFAARDVEKGSAAAEPQYRVSLMSYRYYPSEGWHNAFNEARPLPVYRTNQVRSWGRCMRVAPGESVTVELADDLLDGDGFYIYEIYFWLGESVEEDDDGFYVEYSGGKAQGEHMKFTWCQPFQVNCAKEFPAETR